MDVGFEPKLKSRPIGSVSPTQAQFWECQGVSGRPSRQIRPLKLNLSPFMPPFHAVLGIASGSFFSLHVYEYSLLFISL